jgi:deoxyribodipyrimidine photo-lyase
LSKKFGNKIFQLHGLDNKYPYENISKEIFLKWSEFNTGNDFIDANMKELYLTGYMSNRGRQNVASYWCKDLKQDWRVGASWFEYLLIDYDVHINWCNWQYIAGIGVDPRADRYFNTAKQAATYDPNNTYRKHWLQ